jgi:adenylosuccinate lyase
MSKEELEARMDPAAYVGRAPRQVEKYLEDVVRPVLDERKELIGATGEVSV